MSVNRGSSLVSPWCIVYTLNLWQGFLQRGVEIWIDVCSKKSPSKAFYGENQLIMTRMEKFLDGKAFSRLKFLYVSSIMVNSKFRLNTVVYDIVVPYISLKR